MLGCCVSPRHNQKSMSRAFAVREAPQVHLGWDGQTGPNPPRSNAFSGPPITSRNLTICPIHLAMDVRFVTGVS